MDNTKLVEALTKAIGYVENGGKPNINKPSAGKTGEMASIFQFTPDTWKKDSKEVFGKEVPITPDAETHVMLSKIKKQLDQGYTPEQILSMHNAGVGEPNAYSGKFSNGHPSIGVNAKYGVRFDVPSYVKKGMKYFQEFSGEKPEEEMAQNTPEQQPAQSAGGATEAAQNLVQIMNEASQNQSQMAQKPVAPQPQQAPVAQNTGLLGQMPKQVSSAQQSPV